MLKYNFKELNKPVVIDEPAIADVIITNNNKSVSVTVTTAAGQDETRLNAEEGEDIRFTAQIGNVEQILFGGTDNWGYYKLIIQIENEVNADQYDSILVNNITVDPVAGENDWCRCEQIDKNTLKYTAISKNTSSQPRYAIFKHKTTDKIISGGEAAGRPAAPEWYVTVMQEGTDGQQIEPTPSPTPDPTPTPDPQPDPDPDSSDLGNFLYKVGLISDLHVSADNDEGTDGTGATSTTSDDNWWDEDDFRRAMNIMLADNNIKFVASCGDITESGSPLDGTPENDSNDFYNIYQQYWPSIRFFTCLGNHDFWGMYESRNGDETDANRRNDLTIYGYNNGVKNRIGNIWYDGNTNSNNIIWGIQGDGVNGRNISNRMQFEGYEQTTSVDQGDINYFAFNSFIETYWDQFTYPNKPSEVEINSNSLSAATDYIKENWATLQNKIGGWNTGKNGMRNGYSKLNYWIKKDNDIYVFMSVDYGNDTWQTNNTWHDRMVNARTIIPTDQSAQNNNIYIKRMVEYVDGTGYTTADEQYNYQYYDPNVLIWLKELIEDNQGKKIYVFTHHFMPHRVGNGDPVHDNLPKDGGYHYSSINKDGNLTTEQSSGIQYNSGSNTITGIEFWFLNKLMNSHKNVIWFSGHSHISWENDCHFDNHDYEIVSPSTENAYVYTRNSNTPTKSSAWNVSLPSLSKPRYINNGSSLRLWEDAEMGIMEVYEKGVKIKGYKIRDNNEDANVPLAEKSIKLID